MWMNPQGASIPIIFPAAYGDSQIDFYYENWSKKVFNEDFKREVI